MDDWEQQIKDALARKAPPPWLEAKVLGRATVRPTNFGLLRWVVAMASVLVIATGIWTDHRDGVRAKAQLELALKITAAQLGRIQQTVRASTEEE